MIFGAETSQYSSDVIMEIISQQVKGKEPDKFSFDKKSIEMIASDPLGSERMDTTKFISVKVRIVDISWLNDCVSEFYTFMASKADESVY